MQVLFKDKGWFAAIFASWDAHKETTGLGIVKKSSRDARATSEACSVQTAKDLIQWLFAGG